MISKIHGRKNRHGGESSAIEISRNRHLVEIEKLQAHQKKLKRENVKKFLKKLTT